jgi:hypothetical protein
MRVTATSRDPAGAHPPQGVTVIGFEQADEAIAEATHVVATAPPGPSGDPALHRHAEALAAAPRLGWAGYLSTTGVYGDRDGGWVDEATPPAPGSDRARRRVAAEQAWAALAHRTGGRDLAVDLFRVAGIYGPGRSAFDDLRAGRARRVVKPGHAFGRIHRDDIAGAVLAAALQAPPPGVRADVIAEAAALLGLPAPPAIPFAEARAAMSEMAASFWAENRKVASAETQRALAYRWRHPSYREGLRAILAEEAISPPAPPPASRAAAPDPAVGTAGGRRP